LNKIKLYLLHVHLKEHLHGYFVGVSKHLLYGWAGDYSGLLPSAFQASGKKTPLFKFAPGEFVEPLTVQTLPVEAVNQLL
jgi:hypothetical protein